jgi:4-carboxymuconolactone decarboxylase
MPFSNISAKQLRRSILLILVALIAEFFILEGTIGISLPSDRYHATSSVEISTRGLDQHIVTRNYRFSVVGSGTKTVVLREYFFSDKEDEVEGPLKASITVEGMTRSKVNWTFREPGERGDALTDNVYRVIKWSAGEAPNGRAGTPIHYLHDPCQPLIPNPRPQTPAIMLAMEKQTFDKGMSIRREMFGAELADKTWAAADDFNRPLEELVNQYCFGEIWARPGLDRKTRSIVTLSMLTGLNRPNQIRAHVKGAIANGVSKEELKELFLQAAIYCGVPAAVDSFRIAREVFKEMGI